MSYVEARGDTESVSAQGGILVGVEGTVVHVRVVCGGSFQNSTPLREFARQMMGRGYREFVVDLSQCPVMDSTFMGTLTGVALHLRKLGAGSVRIVRANLRNVELLRNLGLHHILRLEGESPPAPAHTPTALEEAECMEAHEQAQAMLEAHEALVGAEPSNLTQFRDVLEFLRQSAQSGPQA